VDAPPLDRSRALSDLPLLGAGGRRTLLVGYIPGARDTPI
jgi:hypothetical protein